MKDLIDRKRVDLDKLTLAHAHAVAIATVPGALAKWQSSRDAPPDTVDRSEHAVRRQAGAFGRLMGLFPKAVRRKSAT